jgi:hypothetical protein
MKSRQTHAKNEKVRASSAKGAFLIGRALAPKTCKRREKKVTRILLNTLSLSLFARVSPSPAPPPKEKKRFPFGVYKVALRKPHHTGHPPPRPLHP